MRLTLPKDVNPDDPKNHLPEPARQRILRARLECSLIRDRALAAVHAVYDSGDRTGGFGRYCSKGQPKIDLNNASFEGARVVVLAIARELITAGISGRQFMLAMDGEVEAAVNSLELSLVQRDLLKTEILMLELEMDSAAQQTEPVRCDPKITERSGRARANSQVALAERRRVVVEPLLSRKGLTKSGWAAQAGVDSSVVYDYLAGRSRPRPSTRNDLAAALDIPVAGLPD